MLGAMPSEMSKPYRAWPEFAGMTDAQADEIYQRAASAKATRAERLETLRDVWPYILIQLFVCVPLVIYDSQPSRHAQPPLGLGLSAVIAMISIVFIVRVETRRLRERVAKIISECQCSCGYPLRDVPPAPGIDPPSVVCPECGSTVPRTNTTAMLAEPPSRSAVQNQ